MYYRANQGTPLSPSQVDANFKEAVARARSPLVIHIPGPDTGTRPYAYSNMIGTVVSSTTFSLNTPGVVRMWPFVPDYTFTASELSIYITTANSSNLFRLALYSSDSFGYPSALLHSSPQISTYYTGRQLTQFSLTFQVGVVYWFAINTSGSGGVLRGTDSRMGIIHWDIHNPSEFLASGLRISNAFSSMPSTIPFTSWSTNGETASVVPAFSLG